MHKSPRVFYSKKSSKPKIVNPLTSATAQNSAIAQSKKRKGSSSGLQKKNKEVLSSDSDFEMNDQELKSRDRLHVRKFRSEPEEDDADSEASDYQSCSLTTSVDFSQCTVGRFAAVHSLYHNNYGLSIMKVSSVN